MTISKTVEKRLDELEDKVFGDDYRSKEKVEEREKKLLEKEKLEHDKLEKEHDKHAKEAADAHKKAVPSSG
jgi:hypothetical protein